MEWHIVKRMIEGPWSYCFTARDTWKTSACKINNEVWDYWESWLVLFRFSVIKSIFVSVFSCFLSLACLHCASILFLVSFSFVGFYPISSVLRFLCSHTLSIITHTHFSVSKPTLASASAPGIVSFQWYDVKKSVSSWNVEWCPYNVKSNTFLVSSVVCVCCLVTNMYPSKVLTYSTCRIIEI